MKAQNIYSYKALRNEGYAKQAIIKQIKEGLEIDSFKANYFEDGSVIINATAFACPFDFADFEVNITLESTLDQLGVSQYEKGVFDFGATQSDLEFEAPRFILQNISQAQINL